MSEETQRNRPTTYIIKIKGRLDESWSEWFEPMIITHTDDGDTTLKGELSDQAALQGVIVNLGNLNLEIISVNPVEEGNALGNEDDDS